MLENVDSTDKVKEMRITYLSKSGIDVNSGKTPGLAGAEFTIKLNSAVQKSLCKRLYLCRSLEWYWWIWKYSNSR